MRLTRIIGIISVAWLAVVLVGTSTEAADRTKVKLAEVIRSHFYVPMYVALNKGFAADEGLDVEMITANGGDRAGAMVLSDQVDFALAGPEVPIYIYNGESPDKPVIFCALTTTDGLFLASRKKIDNFSWSMLSGKKILGWRPGSTPELYLEYVMKQRGVDAATVKGIVTNIAIPARDGAWLTGNFDFGIFNEPNLTAMEKRGDGYFVASTGKEVGRADYTMFFAKKSWIAQHGEIAQKWTNAIARAQAWVKSASEQDIATTVASYFPGLSVEDNVTVIKRYRTVGLPLWAESTVVDKAGLAKAQEIMVVGNVLPADKTVPYENIVTTEFATKAQQRTANQ